jgi:dTDP-4-amino-4,6-dideoxygalactose transaminase
VLRVGLKHLNDWTERRRALGQIYTSELQGSPLRLLREQPYARSVYHLFVVRHPRRDAIMAALKEQGIGTLVHYPIPLHLQPALAPLGGRPGDLPVAEQAANEVFSLPLYPELTDGQARAVAAAVRRAAEAVV